MTTLKKYTLTDLKEKEIAVKLTKRDDYEILLKALDCDYSSNFYEDEPYYGVDDEGFGLLYSDELEGRILLESIDEIDLEEKEELTTPLKIRTVDFLESLVRDCENKITRLKEELEKSQEAGRCIAVKLADEMKEKVSYMKSAQCWKDSYQGVFKRYNDLEQSQPLAVLESTTDQSERTRMAWEFLMKSVYSTETATITTSADKAFELVDSFLAKSKEVKP